MGKINWNQRHSLTKQGGGSIKAKGLMKTNNDNPDREPTIKELEEQLRRKKLKEELAKKANKQSRDYDESMLGVCHTCHVPIYYGEPIHKLETRDSESSYSGWYAGGRDGAGMFETGTSTHGGYHQGKNKSHSVLEGWIQCGFCYSNWKEEIKTLEKWEKNWKKWGAIIGIPFGLIGIIAYVGLIYLNRGKTEPRINSRTGLTESDNSIGIILLVGLVCYLLGSFIGGLIWYFKRGERPSKPDRYRIRKNPYRDTLVWKLDNEGNPVKEGSQQINKYGMILDPERDKIINDLKNIKENKV